jgi:L-ascorbate metabolism protein UlaG (beta-lactamase superfamily)
MSKRSASEIGDRKRAGVVLRVGLTTLAMLLLTSVGWSQSPDTIRTAGGPISVQPIAHGTLALVYGRHVVLIDPARFVPSYPEAPREDLQELAKTYIAKFGAPPKPPASSDEEPNPDLLVSALPIRPEQIARFRHISPTIILITHTHTDHLDPRAIAAVRMPQTRIIIPTVARGMLLDVQGAETMGNGDRITIDDLTIEAVPMYNPRPDPEHGAIFHPKGRGNGYVVSLGGTRVYVGGDTGCTAEMRALRDVEVAFVPMNLPYTMSPDEAAACVKAMKPRVVYPYHFFGSDPKAFGAALQGTGIEVRLRDWYAAGR